MRLVGMWLPAWLPHSMRTAQRLVQCTRLCSHHKRNSAVRHLWPAAQAADMSASGHAGAFAALMVQYLLFACLHDRLNRSAGQPQTGVVMQRHL